MTGDMKLVHCDQIWCVFRKQADTKVYYSLRPWVVYICTCASVSVLKNDWTVCIEIGCVVIGSLALNFTQVMRGVHLQVPKCTPLLSIAVTTGRIVLKFMMSLLATSFKQVMEWGGYISKCKRANRFSMHQDRSEHCAS